MAGKRNVANERYVRNDGIRGLYKRGKIFYRLKGGKWESLGTTVRREAIKLKRQLDERDIALKFQKITGLRASKRAFAGWKRKWTQFRPLRNRKA